MGNKEIIRALVTGPLTHVLTYSSKDGGKPISIAIDAEIASNNNEHVSASQYDLDHLWRGASGYAPRSYKTVDPESIKIRPLTTTDKVS